MSAGQPIDDELEGRRVHFDLQAACERGTNTTATAGWGRGHESSGRTDQVIAIPQAASTPREINIDKRDGVLVSTASRDGLGVRAGIIISALVGSFGLAWIVTGTLDSPFGLAWLGGWNPYRFLDPIAATSSPPEQSLDSSRRIPDSKKGDRLQTGGVAASTVRETGREATAEAPDSPKLSSFSSASSSDYGHKPSLGAAPPAPSASNHSTVAQQHTIPNGSRAGGLQAQAKLTPTPETRPTTIEGWTLREVINGTAVLEGPNGIWRATTGDTVPEVGRVDSIVRWGNRWIVATSRGLISTP
jgi:hypothetical protein